MSTQAILFKNFPGTDVYNVFYTPAQEKGEDDTFFVYISKFLSKNSVEVKPMTFTNTDSVRNGRAITEHGFVAGVEKGEDNLVFKIYHVYASKFSEQGEIKISLVTDKKTFVLGTVELKDVVLRDYTEQLQTHEEYDKYLQAGAEDFKQYLQAGAEDFKQYSKNLV